MKLLHKIKFSMLRRALVRQRAQNIADIRAGRAAARRIRREMVRNLRLANIENRPASEHHTAQKSPNRGNRVRTAAAGFDGRLSPILEQVRFERVAQ